MNDTTKPKKAVSPKGKDGAEKRPRGRPRNLPLESIPKKPRGRPKSSNSKESIPKRPRGRPKGSKSKKSATSGAGKRKGRAKKEEKEKKAPAEP